MSNNKNLGLHEESLERLRTRRLIYLILAILCSIMPLISPVFHFHSDTGMLYERSYKMSYTTVQTILTEHTTGIYNYGDSLSITKLTITLSLLIVCCIIIFGMNFTYRRYTMWACYAAVAIGVIYYIMLIDLGVQISDDLCATFSPNWSLFFPAISMEMLLMVKLNIEKDIKGDF